ncbi:MAG: phosphate ABC transporter permease PstA [Caldilinea sp.]|jgi:phosphate transport system permease protein|nr:phosphate ABC transporter permease PstA [Caldilinea sp.]
MAVETQRPKVGYPEGRAFERFLRWRKRLGALWGTLFFLSTLIGIVVLVVLVADIVDGAFGYVALEYRVDPENLVLDYHKNRMVSMPRTLPSEDDLVLVNGIAQRPAAIGFMGYAYYQQKADTVRALSVDGVLPDAVTVTEGSYPLARPLFLYADAKTLASKPEAAVFVGDYLRRVDEVVGSVGYFPAGEAVRTENLAAWALASGLSEELQPAVQGELLVTGSSTVAPITQRIADRLVADNRFSGQVQIESIGTDAGFRRFCADLGVDLVDASRPMQSVERAACLQAGRAPIEFQIANDGLPVVVSSQNEFVRELTRAQLQQIFTSAVRWNEIDPSWPDQDIFRFIPGLDSGTLDFFVTALFGRSLAEQSTAVLLDILTANISAGRLRALEAERPLAELSKTDLVGLIEAEVLRPQVAASWSLTDSLLRRTEIEAAAAAMPGTELIFKSWVTWEFLTSPQSSDPLHAGVRTAIFGSLLVTLVAFLLAVPLGIAAAIYLEEYNSGRSWFDRMVETNINNLAGVPSIIYGMLGLAVFVRFLGPLTSGLAFGVGDPSTANGRTIVSAGLTLGLLVLPLVIINGREAIRAVPRGIREGSFGLGATQWQTVWSHVLPNAIPGILTGVILAVSRAFGETAPLIVVGASTFVVVDPSGLFAKFTSLPVQIYQWTSRPQPEFGHLAAAAIVVLLLLLVSLNALAIWLRNRYSRRVI